MEPIILNSYGLPSEEELQQLANAYFKAPQLDGAGIHTDDPFGVSSMEQPGFTGAQFGAVDVNNSMPSLTGFGASPSAIEQPYALGLNDNNYIHEPQTSIPDPHFEEGKIPHSAAGSGITPSVTASNQAFNIHDPQTSIPDPHFEEGIIPQSKVGNGISPSIVKKENTLPFENSNSFEQELKAALNDMISFFPSAQIPVNIAPGIGEAAFYFLSGTGYLHSDRLPQIPVENRQNSISPVHGFVKPSFDINLVKQDFPILQEKVNGKQIVWLDNAATTQKPRQVIERLSYFYEHENSNIHRAAHELAARATDAYEGARKKVQHFLNAASDNEIVFVRGTTEGINLIAGAWGEQFLNSGDEIILSHLEHHANIVPWQLLAKKKGLVIKVIPVDDDGQIILDEYARLLSSKTKFVSFTQVSNALGTITPAKQMVEMAHAVGAKVLVDGAQSVSHMRTDVQLLNADFFVFSGHKVFAPTGIGVVYGKEELLNQMQPYQGGGNMIKDVTFEHTQFHNAPARFEAGTGNIADAVGLGAAIDYVSKLGIDAISVYEHALLQYGTAALKTVPGIRLIGTAHQKASVMSFVLDGYSNDEVGQALNKEGIAVRTGHHCAQPILRRFGLESTVRPSLAFYNTCSDVDKLVEVLHRLAKGKKKL